MEEYNEYYENRILFDLYLEEIHKKLLDAHGPDVADIFLKYYSSDYSIIDIAREYAMAYSSVHYMLTHKIQKIIDEIHAE